MSGERQLLAGFRSFFDATASLSSDSESEVKINILKLLTPIYAFQTLKQDGFCIGDKLYGRALAASANPGVYRYERAVSAAVGRPRSTSESAINDHWLASSKPAADGTRRLLHSADVGRPREQHAGGMEHAGCPHRACMPCLHHLFNFPRQNGLRRCGQRAFFLSTKELINLLVVKEE